MQKCFSMQNLTAKMITETEQRRRWIQTGENFEQNPNSCLDTMKRESAELQRQIDILLSKQKDLNLQRDALIS